MSLYGTLSARLHADYEKQTSALNANAAAINRFDEHIIKPFALVPHVKEIGNGKVGFVAHCPRGRDHAPLLVKLAAAGYSIGEPEQSTYQFNDGYTIWTAPVTSREISFCLVFYTREVVQ